jgi:hypothetical protein
MPVLLIALFRAVWNLRRDRGFRILAAFAVIAVSSATAFYWRVENLNAVDSFYLSTTTITTIGYGDVTPKTDNGKIFTAVYAFVGVGTFAAFLTMIAGQLGVGGKPKPERPPRPPQRAHAERGPPRRRVREPRCTRRS